MSDVAHLSDADRRRLERYLRGKQRGTSLETDAAITPRSFLGPAPLSFSQEQVLRLARNNPDYPPFYNECVVLHRQGPLDKFVLERSLLEIIRRHEIWRTTYDTVDGRLVQIVHSPPKDISMPVLDLRGLSIGAQEHELIHYVGDLAQRPFDLKQGPLLLFLLVNIEDHVHRLFLIAHQSIIDGVSAYQVFPTEVATLYEAFAARHCSLLPEPMIQFADYADWQRRSLVGERLDQQLSYWRTQLSGHLPIVEWPITLTHSPTATHRGAILPFAFRKELAGALRSMARREGITLFMALLSGFVALLHSYTSQSNIVVATLSPAGRKRTELLKLLGYFLNPVVLRFDLSSNPTFHQLLQRTREVVSDAISHDDVPLEMVAEELRIRSDSSRIPFCNVAVSLQPAVPEIVRDGWDVTSMDVGNGGAPWDLYIAFLDRADGLFGRAQYNLDLFNREVVRHMLSDLEVLLESLIVSPDLHLAELHKLTDKLSA
jgi:hypothetical protein